MPSIQSNGVGEIEVICKRTGITYKQVAMVREVVKRAEEVVMSKEGTFLQEVKDRALRGSRTTTADEPGEQEV